MAQNRNKLFGHLAGNLTTAVVHKILEQATSDEYLKKYYANEASNSIEKARSYRERINPVDEPLAEKDATEIRARVIRSATAELKARIVKGYREVNLEPAARVTEQMLIELKIVIL
jgi:hypothetical protein